METIIQLKKFLMKNGLMPAKKDGLGFRMSNKISLIIKQKILLILQINSKKNLLLRLRTLLKFQENNS